MFYVVGLVWSPRKIVLQNKVFTKCWMMSYRLDGSLVPDQRLKHRDTNFLYLLLGGLTPLSGLGSDGAADSDVTDCRL